MASAGNNNNDDNKSSPIKVGVVGFGMSAEVFHCPLITSCPRMTLCAVVERHRNRSSDKYPDIAVVRSLDDLLAIPDIDLVVIATANDTHADYAERVLRAGKHCVVEKPFTVTSDEARHLCDVAKMTGKVLSVFHNRRWDGDFLTVKDILAKGVLGEVVEVESRFDRFRAFKKPNAWRETTDFPASGVLYDLGSHLFDQALTLFGEPETIFAHIRNERRIENGPDDSFLAILNYPALNLRVVCRAGMLVRTPPPRFSLFGTKGSFIKYGLDVQENQLKQGLTPATNPDVFGVDVPENHGQLELDTDGATATAKSCLVETKRGQYLKYYENIADAILGTGKLEVTPEQAAKVIRLIELAKLSDAEGRVVKIE
ncbi:hypothetical protein EV182_000864 [Spiromyces aspiralis]|uniref:Uncharacterized protein n=1 Tax=Spiromyces aspiralis TaxID=68401 RepID=A0ACC1HVF3_9FUNG|nr:hypothetical protein EV182_000864 [Spiromyces aspiralis]